MGHYSHWKSQFLLFLNQPYYQKIWKFWKLSQNFLEGASSVEINQSFTISVIPNKANITFIEFSLHKTKVSIKDFKTKYEQSHRKLWTCSYLLKKSVIEKLIFCSGFADISRTRENYRNTAVEILDIDSRFSICYSCSFYAHVVCIPSFQVVLMRIWVRISHWILAR